MMVVKNQTETVGASICGRFVFCTTGESENCWVSVSPFFLIDPVLVIVVGIEGFDSLFNGLAVELRGISFRVCQLLCIPVFPLVQLLHEIRVLPIGNNVRSLFSSCWRVQDG
jgi:hypothetical protein